MTLTLQRSLEMPSQSIAHYAANPQPAIPLEPWQYRLTKSAHRGAETLGAFWLSIGQGLGKVEVVDRAGRPFGVLLGFPIDLDAASLISGTWVAPPEADLGTDTGIHRALRALGGLYVWIYTSQDRNFIFPDAMAQVTCVWDASTQSAGSTALAILDTAAYTRRFDEALFNRLGIKGEGWFPAGLTAHSGVQRLLANHALDLDTWQSHRIDVSTPEGFRPSTSEVVAGVARTVQTQMTALAKGPKSPVVALTGGRDSRAVLACLKECDVVIRTITVTSEDRYNIDTQISKKISAAENLTHIELHPQVADAEAQALFLKRGGHCFGDGNMAAHPSVHPIAQDHVFAGGLGGEIAQGFYWRENDTPATEITAADHIRRMGLPFDQKLEQHVQTWLDDLPSDLDALEILDLAYIELRMGPWASAQFCADPTLVRYAPMVSYDSLRLMLALPEDWKRTGRLNAELVATYWPSLNTYPYNTLGRFKDTWIMALRILRNPALVSKKLRQRFG